MGLKKAKLNQDICNFTSRHVSFTLLSRSCVGGTNQKKIKDTGFCQVRGRQPARWGVKNFFMLFVNDKIGSFTGITFGRKAVTLSEWSTVQCVVSWAVFTPIYFLGMTKWHCYITLRLGRLAGRKTQAYWAQLWSLRLTFLSWEWVRLSLLNLRLLLR